MATSGLREFASTRSLARTAEGAATSRRRGGLDVARSRIKIKRKRGSSEGPNRLAAGASKANRRSRVNRASDGTRHAGFPRPAG